MRSSEANFIDMDVISAGPIVREQSQAFDRYWNSSVVYPVQEVVAAMTPAVADAASVERFDELVTAAPPELLRDARPARPHLGRLQLSAGRMALSYATAQVFADTPYKGSLRNPGDTLSTVNRSVLEEFATAARSSILIASPYFIPGKEGMKFLKAAMAHKLRISVLTNGVGATDEQLVYWRYSQYRLEMLKLGIQLYEVSPTLARDVSRFGVFGRSFRRLHAKVAVIDRERLFIGSMNFDPRSAWSNTESGLLVDRPSWPIRSPTWSTRTAMRASIGCAWPLTARRSNGWRAATTARSMRSPKSPITTG